MIFFLALIACNPYSNANPEEDDTGWANDSDDEELDSENPSPTVDTDLDPIEEPETVALPPLLSAPATLPGTAINRLVADIDDLLDGTTHGAYILDAENQQVVYESNPDARLKPASNAKLFITAISMERFGEDDRYTVELWAPASPSGGTVASLTALSLHDSTWSGYVTDGSTYVAQRIADLAWEAGIRRISGTLMLAGEALVNGDSLGTYSATSHRARAAVALQNAFTARGISVGSSSTTDRLSSPGGVKIAERASAALSASAQAVNTYSHNEMADIELRRLGYALGGTSSYAVGAREMIDALGDMGIDTSDLAFFDGSGLSHSNRVTARSVVELLEVMQAHPHGEAWERGLAIAGVRGTIENRMTGADTLGRFYAKTGTLRDTIALSGILHNAHDGHRYLISILQNSVGSQSGARATADAVVKVVAKDWRSGADRPAKPEILSATARNGVMEVSWTAVAGAASYGVWLSNDGKIWDRAQAYSVTSPSMRFNIDSGYPTYVRVIAVNSKGWSEPSDVYAGQTGPTKRVLLVDGDTRWDDLWENTLGRGHDSVARVAFGIEGRSFDSASAAAVVNGAVQLDDYDAVVWLLGEESTVNKTFDASERTLVQEYLGSGGSLLVSGSEVAWDLDNKGTSETQTFYNQWLHADYAGDDAGTWGSGPSTGGIFEGLPEINFYSPTGAVIDYPDQITPSNGAEAALDYLAGSGGTAAVTYDGDYAVVTFGFPIEAIDGADRRQDVLERVFDFFGI